MKYKARVFVNWAVVTVLALFFGGIVVLGVIKEQPSEVLFNATLV